jgi:hypothetical protein
MGNLGLMEPEQLLQLFMGAIGGAFVVFLLLVGYVVMSRRKKSGGMRHGSATTGHQRAASVSRDYLQPPADAKMLNRHAAAIPPAQPELARSEGGSSVDVSARLAGTGREAWLEDASSPPEASPPVEEAASFHGRELLRLVCDPGSQQVFVRVAGMRYHSLNDIRDRAVGQRILAAITHALQFSNGMAAGDHGVVTLNLPACDAVRVPTAFGALSDAREEGELIRLMGDPARNHFCVHVAGHCYERLLEINESATGQSVLEAITRLLQFSNGLLATNDGVGVVAVPSLRADVHTAFPTGSDGSSRQVPQEPPVSSSAPAAGSALAGASDVPDSGSGEALEDEQERFLRQLRNQSPPAATTLERPSLMGSIRRMRKKPSNDPLPALNLVEEIDSIFQSKLMASSMAGTDAKITAASDGGVGIRVGATYYSSPDEVPDPQLRNMLKLAIAEWERS